MTDDGWDRIFPCAGVGEEFLILGVQLDSKVFQGNWIFDGE